MAENLDRMHVIHYHSVSGASPEVANLAVGEIALGNKAGEEKIFIRNTEDQIVELDINKVLSNQVYFNESITYSGETIVASGETLVTAMQNVLETIIVDEKIIATGLNNLNDRIDAIKDDPSTLISVGSGVTISESTVVVDREWLNEKIEEEVRTMNCGSY